MLSRAAILPWLILPILLVLSTAPIGPSSRLRGITCFRRISQMVTYLQPVRYTQLVRTRKCRFLIFCKTAYRTREAYRMERKTKTTYKMKVECCEGHYEVNRICVADPTHNPRFVTTPRDSSFLSTYDIMPSPYEVPTSTAVQQRTISEDSNQGVGVGSQTNAWIFRNTTESIVIGKNKELHITDSNQTTLIIAFIACTFSVFTIIAVIVIYRRRKKAAKYMSEIPCTPDVMPLPSKSKKTVPHKKLSLARGHNIGAPNEDRTHFSSEWSARRASYQSLYGLNYRNFPPTDENFYMSMDSGCKLQVPSVKMMLATRGSGYRFSGLEEETRRPADSLYVAPDNATYNNQNSKVSVGTNCQDRKCPNKTQHGKSSSDIYINGRDINMADKILDEDDENIYSEIKAKNFKRMDLVGDENGYSFIKMDCVKELAPEERECEAETSLYSSLHECNNSNTNNNNNNGMESVSNSNKTNASDKTKEEDRYDSLIKTKMRTNCSRQTDTGEMETRDDACDSGIYTSINLDSDKDDEANSDATYDKPKKKTRMDETKRREFQQAGSDFYENCRRNSDESNYDIPRSQKKDEEDAIYSDISSSSQATNTSVIARIS